ncbi:peptide deformylase [Pleionea sp. CnH1-48]|uniref:peptide deformylase n=1 Tax=Pleionea sp. CnH1-48 TaxID=2954494 RepID=UPI002097AE39|nr:peptide deformylase [Pleionea sp. CnH1-48]
MAVLEILELPDPRLRDKAVEVTDVASVQTLIDDMLETMYSTPDGIGLASIQVGRRESVIVIDLSEERNDPLVLINAKIVEGSDKCVNEEGCLSVPDYRAKVERFAKVKVSGLDREGKEITVESDDFLAIALQHEIDHLLGVVFIDHLSSLKRSVALKRIKKYQRQQKKMAKSA